MGFGGKAGPGRPKGLQNKTTLAVKEALTLAFEGVGGVPALIEWGQNNPDLFFPLWVKLLPQEVKADIEINGGLAALLAAARERRQLTDN